MTNIEIIKTLKESVFTDEEGKKYKLVFQEGLSKSEIELLKDRFPNETIDKDLIEILSMTKGWDGYGLGMVYFDSIDVFGL